MRLFVYFALAIIFILQCRISGQAETVSVALPRIGNGEFKMDAITYGANAKTASVTAPAEKAPKRQNFFRMLFEAFIEARQMQAEAEIRRHYGNLAHRLPKRDEPTQN